ncbi:hypothetical protein BCR39DRAFT_291604 [Naematelia encephala]|uniref:BTB domain-containing protein n=1 Tax=Naematelia encephala TaxID=71784 RepID=A0A1Y2ART4_9TREE|nr:hypothetical protein BCR39DRAFT_291604 [Naematelia encephala]
MPNDTVDKDPVMEEGDETTESDKENETSKPEPDKFYTEGDVTLISSDNVSFKIQMFYLQASSAVFRETFAVGELKDDNRDIITFTDEAIESSATIRVFLDTITGKQIPSPQNMTFDWIRFVSLFARKYDCPLLAAIFRMVLAQCVGAAGLAGNLLDPRSIFVTAAILDYPEICQNAISNEANWQWGTSEKELTGDDKDITGVVGESVFSPLSMPLQSVRLIPEDYLWALMRSRATEKGEKRAKEFIRLLDVTKRECDYTG